jgi:hypothetical protein
MATRKRVSRRSGIVGRAVSAGRRALREAEKRVPPDVRRQVERRLKDADKTARAAIKQLQAQARKASTRADVNSVLKRIDGLTKQARQIALGTSAGAATTRRRAATTTRRAATRTRKAATTATRKAASTRKAAASRSTTRSTTRRAPSPRRRTTPADETVMVTPVAEMGEVEILEVIEP